MPASVTFILLLATFTLAAQDQTAGQRAYDSRCGRCHGGDGRGSDMAPSIFRGLGSRDDAQLTALIRTGIPGKMPGTRVGDDELKGLMNYARMLRMRARERPVVREAVTLTDGRTLEGELLGQGFSDKQLRSNGKLYLLRRAAGEKYREVTS